MKELETVIQQADDVREQEKRAYTAPELKEHGSVQEVTLQTFFGSFSPSHCLACAWWKPPGTFPLFYEVPHA